MQSLTSVQSKEEWNTQQMQGKKANYQSENLDIESTTDEKKSLKQRR